jgi:type III restriction enzyme
MVIQAKTTHSGAIFRYYPDFIVKLCDGQVVIVETKGQEDLDVPQKMARLRQWCEDINKAQSAIQYDYVFVDESGFSKYRPKTFAHLIASFRGYK